MQTPPQFRSKWDDKTNTLLRIVKDNVAAGRPIRSALVVGCGNGYEAGVLANIFDCQVKAIDMQDTFECPDPRVEFKLMDACAMEFKDSSFDLVYSFHALEHIHDPIRAIREITRVLVANGVYLIGTPNRSRIVGYIGSADTPLGQKIRWNLGDYRDRLLGRFRNELGAHAGFSAEELVSLCSSIGSATNMSDDYYFRIYSKYGTLLKAIRSLKLQPLAWPSVYVWGLKPGSAT